MHLSRSTTVVGSKFVARAASGAALSIVAVALAAAAGGQTPEAPASDHLTPRRQRTPTTTTPPGIASPSPRRWAPT